MSVAQGTLASEERLDWLRSRLRSDGAVLISTAADALGVSEMTIRRDIAELESQGTARRVRGGARSVGPQPFAERRQVAARAKGRIASKLAGLLPASGVVAFDASSTVMRLAAALAGARDLTVVSNGPDTFLALQGLPGVTPLLTGGRLDPLTGSLVGPIACRSADQLSVSTLFASASAVDAAGAFEPTIDEAEVKRRLAARADRVVLAADASKIGRRSTALGLEWGDVDLLVTDLDPSDRRLDPLRGLVEVR